MRHSIIDQAIKLSSNGDKISELAPGRFLVHDIDLIKEVLVKKHKVYKGEPHPYKKGEKVLGPLGFKTLQMSGGPLSGEALDTAYEKAFDQLANKCHRFLKNLKEEKQNNNFNLTDLLSQLMLEVMILVLFDYESETISKEFFDSSVKLENFFERARSNPTPGGDLRRNNPELRKLTDNQDAILKQILEAKGMKTDTGDQDFIITRAMTRTLLNGFAGSSTTLVWMTHLLDTHPEIKAKVKEEIQTLNMKLPGFADLKKLTYLEAVLKETMRLYPAGWMVSRTCSQEDTLGGIALSEDSLIHICIYSLHRDPRYWNNPEEFKPERFLDDSNHKAFIPFSLGPQKCVGASFAFSTMQFIAAILYGHFDLEVELKKYKPIPKVALRPSPEAMVKFL